MKLLISTIIVLTLIVSCSETKKLNIMIHESQKSSLINSPFNTAKGMILNLNEQKKYRHRYLKSLDKLIKQYPNDTIILTENYDYICFECPAEYAQVLIDTTLFNFTLSRISQKSIKLLSKDLRDSNRFFYSDFYELRTEMAMGDDWNSQPAKYGTENCLDGGHTFYTVIYPSGKIISLFMRCWIDKECRDRYKR